MRRRLRGLVFAVTTLVVTAFVVPLGVLVFRQADLRARTAAERQAQDVAARLVGVLVAAPGDLLAGEVGAALGELPTDVGVVLPGSAGGTLGSATGEEGVVLAASAEGRAISAYVDGGWELAVPVVIRTGSAVVWVRVPDSVLREGVVEAVALLVLLGLVMVAAALFVADRLGRSMTDPMADLATAARRLGEGELDTRVRPAGPPEVVSLGESFNWLAGRLRDLLADERETVADLSHRLRTPLTSLRLQAERIGDPEERETILEQVTRLDTEVGDVIADARRPSEAPTACDLAAIVRDRTRFWSVLAEEQGREVTVSVPVSRVEVALSEREAASIVDSLLGNVFTHTPPGTAFEIRVEPTVPSLIVSDRGTGWDASIDPFERGSSGAGSSGLGLDIVRKTVQRIGGSADAMSAPQGGALIEVRFGPAGAGDGWGG